MGLALDDVPPGRGEPGASVDPLAAGPIDWRACAFLTGSGDGLGLSDGGRRLAMVKVYGRLERKKKGGIRRSVVIIHRRVDRVATGGTLLWPDPCGPAQAREREREKVMDVMG